MFTHSWYILLSYLTTADNVCSRSLLPDPLDSHVHCTSPGWCPSVTRRTHSAATGQTWPPIRDMDGCTDSRHCPS